MSRDRARSIDQARRSGTSASRINDLTKIPTQIWQNPMQSLIQMLHGYNSTPVNTAYFNSGMGLTLDSTGRVYVLPQDFVRQEALGNHIIQTNQIQQKPSIQDNYVYNTYKNKIPETSPTEVCSTSSCVDEAKDVKNMMNEKIDPCDDFYQFACGGFVHQHNIARDQVEVTHFSILRDRVATQLRTLFEERIQRNEAKPFQLVKTMYKSCMNERLIESQGFQPLFQVLDEVGGWAVLLGDNWQPQEEFKWENFVVWYRELGLGLDYFMKISIEPDLQNVGKRFITIGEPGLGVSDQLLKRGLNEPIVNAYYEFMVETAVLMGADRTRAKKEMLDVANFEINMAKCFYRPEHNSRSGTFYNPMTIQQLSSKYPLIPWLALFQRLVPSKISITDQEVIMVAVPQYMDCFFNLLKQTEQR